MSDRPTPETDSAQCEGLLRTNPIPMQVVTANFARKLERERDEAREDLEFRRGLYKVQEEHLENARKELREWQTLCLWGGTPEHIHNFIKGQQTRIHEAQDIEKTCENLEQERDEAREAIRALAEHGESVIQRITKERDKYKQERDEAREIAKEADAGHDMAIADLAKCEAAAEKMVVRANELIVRWDQPSWKDTAPTARFINALRIAVRAYERET